MNEQWKFRISFINVGNGDAILIELKEESLPKGSFVMLIDGGSGEAWEYENNSTGRLRAAEFLAREMAGPIDVMVNTHIHEDHTCGLWDVLAQTAPAVFWQPFDKELWKQMRPLAVTEDLGESERKFIAALNDYLRICEKIERQGGKIEERNGGTAESGDIMLSELPSELKIRVLGPSVQAVKAQEQRIRQLYQQVGSGEAENSGSRELVRACVRKLDAAMNDVSMVLFVEYMGHSFLLPGDTQVTGYQMRRETLRAETFKVGHHGQANALDEELLGAVAPKYAIISASSDRRYESAAPKVLRMLHDFGTKTYFTDVPDVPPYTDGLMPHAGVAFAVAPDGSMSVRYLQR